MRAEVLSFEMTAPDDMSGLAAALDVGALRAEDVVCVIGKTEGNGLDNDHTRAFATAALARLIGGRLGLDEDALFDRISLVLSGGTEGVLNPHMTVFAVRNDDAAPGAEPALAIGRAFSRPVAPEQVGRMAQVEATAEAVRAAIAAAGIDDPADVAYVLAKGVLLMPPDIAEARRRGVALCAGDTHGSKPFTRAATALGVALALDEVEARDLNDGMIATAREVYSAKACVTPGIDRPRSEVVVFGNSRRWSGDLRVASGAYGDLIDSPAVAGVLDRLGLSPKPQLAPAERARIAAVIVKGEPSRSDSIRGRRHTMWRDSDVHALRHFRAAMGGMLAALTGDTRFYIAAGAEHQGPPGGGTIAVFARRG